jgi:hypothetical protein
MNKKYMYVFVVTHRAPCDKREPVVHYFFEERNTPLDSHLYYKMRRNVFGLMDERYWTANVEVFRTQDPFYIGKFALAIATVRGSMRGFDRVAYYDFTLYNYQTCVGVFARNNNGRSSCWNWPKHGTPRDWRNHTEHNDYIRPWRW